MRKKDIIQELVGRTSLTTSQATHAVDNVVGIITEALASGDTVFLRGFGTFKTVLRAAKTARNVSKGTAVHIPPRWQVKFIAYNNLKERIKHGHEV